MPLLLSRSDLRPLASDDGALDGAIDAVEASLVRSHGGDPGQTVFAGLTLANGDELATQFAASQTGPASLRLFPNRVTETRQNAWLGLQIDGTTGAVASMIALDDLNVLRTSVPAAVGVRHLAPPGATTLTVLGSSIQARSHARTIRRVMPHLNQIRVWSPTAASREAFGTDLRSLADDVQITVADTVDAAVDGADVITAAGRYSWGENAIPDPAVIRPGALVVSMTGAGGNALKAGARLTVPTTMRPKVVAFGFASGWLSGNPPPMPQDFLELGDVIAGKEEARRFPSETLVFELANPYMWDVPILEWIRAWATKQGLGSDFDFSA